MPLSEELRNVDGSDNCWVSRAALAEFLCVPAPLVADVLPAAPFGQRYLRKWLWTVLVAGSRNARHLDAIEARLDRVAAKAKTRVRLAQQAHRYRRAILERDGPACAYCGTRPRGKRRLTLDHVVPVSSGGASVLGNLVQACFACNIDKRDLHLVDWARDSLERAHFMRGRRQAEAFAVVRLRLAACRRMLPAAAPGLEADLEAAVAKAEAMELARAPRRGEQRKQDAL
jgi:hypothetical protein